MLSQKFRRLTFQIAWLSCPTRELINTVWPCLYLAGVMVVKRFF